MKTIIVSAAIFLTAFAASGDKLTGRWQTKPSVNGNVTSIHFKEDKSFEGYINRKPFNTGSYMLEDNIFSFTDNGCDQKKGVYKVIFFSNEDSMRFELVSDSCTPRKEGMLRLVLGRIK